MASEQLISRFHMATHSSLLLSLRQRVKFPSPGIHTGFSHLFDQQNAVDVKPDPEMTCGFYSGHLKHSFPKSTCHAVRKLIGELHRKEMMPLQAVLTEDPTSSRHQLDSHVAERPLKGIPPAQKPLQVMLCGTKTYGHPGALPQMHIPEQNKLCFLIQVTELGDSLLYSRM